MLLRGLLNWSTADKVISCGYPWQVTWSGGLLGWWWLLLTKWQNTADTLAELLDTWHAPRYEGTQSLAGSLRLTLFFNSFTFQWLWKVVFTWKMSSKFWPVDAEMRGFVGRWPAADNICGAASHSAWNWLLHSSFFSCCQLLWRQSASASRKHFPSFCSCRFAAGDPPLLFPPSQLSITFSDIFLTPCDSSQIKLWLLNGGNFSNGLLALKRKWRLGY